MGFTNRNWGPGDPDAAFNILSILAGTVLTLGLIVWMATKGLAWIFPWLVFGGLIAWLAIRLYLDGRN